MWQTCVSQLSEDFVDVNQWSQIKTGYLHILDIYFVFLNRKVRHFCKCLQNFEMFKMYHLIII